MRALHPAAALLIAACTSVPIKPPSSFVDVDPRPRVMFFGTFHFADAGLDAYKPQHQLDIMSAPRQRQLEELIDRLARFRPTKIAIEVDAANEARINQRYREYLDGRFTPTSNEIYQVGFRLARRLGHPRLYGVDVNGRPYQSDDEGRDRVKKLGQESLAHTEWDDRFKRLYEYDDELKTKTTLVQFLRYLNSPERLRVGHGHYLTGTFHAGRGDDYLGPDNLAGWWYVRNLRIFENISRIIDLRSDRVLVIIGAGHLPILLQAAQSSPEVEWVDIEQYLE